MSTQVRNRSQSVSSRQSPAGMREVAAHAGVGLKTVSRVVNREPGVTAEMVQRVQASIEALGYTRRTRRAPRSTLVTRGAIGVVVQQLGEPFQARLAAAIIADANERGYVALVSSSEAQPAREQALFDSMQERGVDGVVLVPAPSGVEYQQSFIAGSTPIVVVDRPIPELEVDTVLSDNLLGAREGVQHLLEQGHRRIAIIGADPSFQSIRERFLGYRQALASFDVEPDTTLERMQWLRPNVVSRVLGELAALPEPPTAIFSANGFYSVEIAHALMEAEPISLVCFDEVPMSASSLGGLTTVAQFPEEIANAATELLFRRMAEYAAPPKEIRIRTELLIRASSLISPKPLRFRQK